jgi:Lon protease-like protein
MNLPDQVAVMPLPNAILFPRVMLPLYIFEPRYKKMLADCLRGERMFAVALLRSGWEKKGRSAQPYPVASVGVIHTCVTRPDGTANLVLEGVARVRLLEYLRLRPYRVARIRPLESFEEPAPPPRDQLLAAVAALAKAQAVFGPEFPKPILDAFRTVQNAGYLSDLVSYTLLDDYHQKQIMLETLDVNVRLGKLIELLQQKVRQLQLWKTLQGNLPPDEIGKN